MKNYTLKEKLLATLAAAITVVIVLVSYAMLMSAGSAFVDGRIGAVIDRSFEPMLNCLPRSPDEVVVINRTKDELHCEARVAGTYATTPRVLRIYKQNIKEKN